MYFGDLTGDDHSVHLPFLLGGGLDRTSALRGGLLEKRG